jgi:hypothetical protein
MIVAGSSWYRRVQTLSYLKQRTQLPSHPEYATFSSHMNKRESEILDLLGPSELAALYRGYNARCQEIQTEREKSSRNLEARHATLDHYDLAAGHLKLLEGALLDLVERSPRKARDLADDLVISSDEKLKHLAGRLYEALGER